MKSFAVAGLVLAGSLAFAPVAFAQDAPLAWSAQPAPGVCDLVAADAADLLRSIPIVDGLLGDGDGGITPESIQRARERIGCGAPPQRTAAEAKIAVCAALGIATIEDLLVRLEASEDAQATFDRARPFVPAALQVVSGNLGCNSVTTPPAHPVDVPAGGAGNPGPLYGGTFDQVGEIPAAVDTGRA